jgi:hypothetical protein
VLRGLIFATILAVTGRLLKRRFGPEKLSVSPDASSSSAARPKTGRLSKITAVMVVALLLLVVYQIVVAAESL